MSQILTVKSFQDYDGFTVFLFKKSIIKPTITKMINGNNQLN